MKFLFDAGIKSPGRLIKNLHHYISPFLKNKEPLFRQCLFLTKKFSLLTFFKPACTMHFMTASDQNTDSPQAVPNQPPEDTLFGKEKTVMIIEDDPTSAELIRKLLTSRGFDVIQAKNGKEAWDKIRPETKPDLIISDFLMPEMDGFQFFKGLKKDPQTKDIPTIFLSERKNIQDSLLVSGVDAFF